LILYEGLERCAGDQGITDEDVIRRFGKRAGQASDLVAGRIAAAEGEANGVGPVRRVADALDVAHDHGTTHIHLDQGCGRTTTRHHHGIAERELADTRLCGVEEAIGEGPGSIEVRPGTTGLRRSLQALEEVQRLQGVTHQEFAVRTSVGRFVHGDRHGRERIRARGVARQQVVVRPGNTGARHEDARGGRAIGVGPCPTLLRLAQ